MKKIYFAGSIRGGRDDAELYAKLISHIKESDIVLTEHIGRPDVFFHERHQSDEDIYIQDTGWLKECDMVIAECTAPSLGVGYEMAYAEAQGKPVHIFYNTERAKLSAMLAGDKYFHIHPYCAEDELFTLIDKLLAQ